MFYWLTYFINSIKVTRTKTTNKTFSDNRLRPRWANHEELRTGDFQASFHIHKSDRFRYMDELLCAFRCLARYLPEGLYILPSVSEKKLVEISMLLSLSCPLGTRVQYGITHCYYLPPGRSDIPAFTQLIKAGTHLATIEGCKAEMT